MVGRSRGVLAALALCAALASCGASEGGLDRVGTDGFPPAGPCPPPDAKGNASIGWVDSVVVDGVMLHAATPGGTVSPDAVGEVVATVACRIADTVSNPDFRPREGDATFLPAGAELREIVGSRPRLRLAALRDGGWHVYEAYDVPGARTGEDLLDLRGKVRRVHLVEGERGTDVLTTVGDPAAAQRLVDAVLSAPVLSSDAASARIGGEAPLFVRFDLVDGTSVQRAWHREAEVLASVLEAPDALEELLGPEPAP